MLDCPSLVFVSVLQNYKEETDTKLIPNLISNKANRTTLLAKYQNAGETFD